MIATFQIGLNRLSNCARYYEGNWLEITAKNPFVCRTVPLSSLDFPATVKSAYVAFLVVSARSKSHVKWAMPN
jgi:hypothetical protein